MPKSPRATRSAIIVDASERRVETVHAMPERIRLQLRAVLQHIKRLGRLVVIDRVEL